MRKWRGDPRAILLTLSLGFFMTLLDLTIVNIAIPDVVDSLGASLDEVLWVVNAYALVLAVLLITAGRLGDIHGPRALFIAGIVIFTVASLLCGLTGEPSQLIAARAAQGLGAALLIPQTMTLIMATFPAERRGVALGVWGAIGGAATIAGPTLGGLLVSAFGWRWIFFVNVPIGVVVLAMAVTILPDVRPERGHRFDVPGVLLATAGLFCLVFGLSEGERYHWGIGIWALLAGGVVLSVVFLLHQRTKQAGEPLVPFALFRDRNFAIMTVIAAVVSLALIGLMLPMNLYLQSVLGMSPARAGLVLAPSSVVSLLLAPVAGRLSDRIGGKYVLMFGLATFAVGMLLTAVVAAVDSHWYTFLAPMIVTGTGAGCLLAPMATEAMRNVPPHLAGAASGVNNTVRQIGSVLGAATVGALMQNRLAANLHTEAAERAGQLPPAQRAPFVDGMQKVADGGVQVGGTGGGTHHLIPGLSGDLADRVDRLGDQVYGHAFVSMIHATFVLPIALVAAGALACVAVVGRPKPNPAANPNGVEAHAES